MRPATVYMVLPFMLLSMAPAVSAQAPGWFVTAGMGAIDYIHVREYAPQVSGGMLLRLGMTHVSVGGQGDLLINNGYPGGRGGPLAQVDLLPPDARMQPFASGGYFFSDGGARWMIGGGIDVRLARRAGLRFAVQDAFARATLVELGKPDRRLMSHEPSLQCGFVYR